MAKKQVAGTAAKRILEQYRDFDRIIGCLDVDAALAAKPEAEAEEDVPAEIRALIAKRTEAKKAKDFATADAVRDELKQLGWTVTDTPSGPKAKKL